VYYGENIDSFVTASTEVLGSSVRRYINKHLIQNIIIILLLYTFSVINKGVLFSY
jgi:hypothetical protein